MPILEMLEEQKKKLELKKEAVEAELKKPKENIWVVTWEIIIGKRKSKQGLLTRIVMQFFLFYFNYWIFSLFVEWFGFQEAVILMLATISTIAGYIAYALTQRGN